MKTKKFSKKLALNKKTIADLNNGQLGRIKGGRTFTTCAPELCTEGECQTPACTETCDTQCWFTLCGGYTCYPKCPTYTCDGICN